jgi:hypothetical protein
MFTLLQDYPVAFSIKIPRSREQMFHIEFRYNTPEAGVSTVFLVLSETIDKSEFFTGTHILLQFLNECGIKYELSKSADKITLITAATEFPKFFTELCEADFIQTYQRNAVNKYIVFCEEQAKNNQTIVPCKDRAEDTSPAAECRH